MIERQKLNLELAQKYVQALPNQEHTQLLTTKDLPYQNKYYTFRFGEGDHDSNRPMGVPVASYRGDDGKLYVTQTRYNHHSIVTASSGLGKTQGFILNCAYNLNPSMSYVFADPKGEIAKFSYSRLCEIYGRENVLIANFLDPAHSMVFFNLFTDLAYKWKDSEIKRTKKQIHDHIISELKKILEILCPIESEKDKSWERTARNFYLGEIIGFFEDLCLTTEQSQKTGRQKTTPEMINFESFIKVYNSFKWNEHGYSFEDGGFISSRRKDSPAYTYTYSIINNAGSTRANYLGFVDLYLSRYSDPKILEISRYNNFNAESLSNSPKVLFLVYDITHEAMRDYVNICAAKLISDLLEISHKNAAPLQTPVHFILDEFATLRPSPVYPNLLATGRGSGLYLHMIVQSLEQLHARYPDEWLTMMDNCDVAVFAGTNSLDTAKRFRESLGTHSVVDSEAFLRGEFRVKQELIVSLDYLLHRMERGESFVRVNNAQPIHAGFELYYKTPEYTAYPAVNTSELKSPLPKVSEARCKYRLPKEYHLNDDDDYFDPLGSVNEEDFSKEKENNTLDTLYSTAFDIQAAIATISDMTEQLKFAINEVGKSGTSPLSLGNTEIFESMCMDIIEKIVKMNKNWTRQDCIQEAAKELVAVRKAAQSKMAETVHMRVLREFQIVTDEEYLALWKQIWNE